MDFTIINVGTLNKEARVIVRFRTIGFTDLMIRGGNFYAVWDEGKKLWSTSETDLVRLVDKEIEEYVRERNLEDLPRPNLSVDGPLWKQYRNYIRNIPDTYISLDEKIVFADEETCKEDYVSKRLSYKRSSSEPKAYDELMSVLYSPEERQKIEWMIGSIFTGDSKWIQKFFVFFGAPGTGKSTVLNIIEGLFQGYCGSFESADIVNANNQFALEAFRTNPLVAIEHDGDLSKNTTNARLNTLVGHEVCMIKEKYKAAYEMRINAVLIIGTNKPVKITDANSGLTRRLIDIRPTGKKVSHKRYDILMNQIKFEYGSIANRCIEVFKKLGPMYYDSYRPEDMILRTDMFHNFVEDNVLDLKQDKFITLKRAYDIYKDYCDDSGFSYKLTKQQFRDELRNYFDSFFIQKKIDGKKQINVFVGFHMKGEETTEEFESWIELKEQPSMFDDMCKHMVAQYGNTDEVPNTKWENVRSVLGDLDTSKLHYVMLPKNHIVIDFDIRGPDGSKSFERNLAAASKWPPTYAEVSKGGNGIHLHYIYEGDVDRLSSIYEEGIEVKVFQGKSSLRRKLTLCNDILVATISEGLPMKGEKMVDFDRVMNEKGIRSLIFRNMAKEYHAYTTPSVQFIKKILDDAYESETSYDVRDLRTKVLTFATRSTNQSAKCVEMVQQMKFCSKDVEQGENPENRTKFVPEMSLIFFDVEVFPNLFLVNWKYAGEDKECVRMINPTPSEIEDFIKFPLVGFNNRRYDNHILYARYLGKSNEELFKISQRIIKNEGGFFSEAYNLSYTDIYDFASAAHKKSLKKWEIELGLKHVELNLPWDQPVPEELWPKVAEYCDNDVFSTEAVFNYLKGDWTARKILADLSGLTVNDTTNQHTTKIIFGNEKHPKLNYSDLSREFPGYRFERGVSTYRGEEVGEGGYVYAEPGMYWHVVTFDVASMHPSSIEALRYLGDYTDRYSDLKRARVLIKHNDLDGLRSILDGKLIPYLNDESVSLKDLSNALKTALNSVYGLTAAKFDNPFRDIRNVDNIVAKRGALFMIDLKNAVQAKGWKVVHIKTDSIKIDMANEEAKDFIFEFGKKYGYEFEVESVYDEMCLVNDAVYIAREEEGKWTATGAQFAHPYIFKTLFSKEPLEAKDFWETKSVNKGAIYLKSGDQYDFVGRVGSFVAVTDGREVICRNEDKESYVAGTKGYLWQEASVADSLGLEKDMSYYNSLVDKAKESISKFGDFEMFVEDLPF